MNTLIIPENTTEEKNENYYNILKGLIYAVDKFGIDMVINDTDFKEMVNYLFGS